MFTPYRTAPSLEPTSSRVLPARSGRTFWKRNRSSEMENEWEMNSGKEEAKIRERRETAV